jgi:hypothetical protein
MTALIGSFNVVAKDVAGKNISNSQNPAKIAKESSAVRDIVEQTERVHSVKCKIKSITSSIGDQFLKYKCKNTKRRMNLVLRVNVNNEDVSLRNYKVFFRK